MDKISDKIFEQFGHYYEENDPFVDAQGKGAFERYVESLFEEVDDYVLPYLSAFHDRLLNPVTVPLDLVPYLETNLGGLIASLETKPLRRKILEYASPILQSKGSLQCLRLLFRLAGFADISIDEVYKQSGFDSSLTFDDGERVFDAGDIGNDTYSITLVGDVRLTNELVEDLFRLAAFNEPVYTKLKRIIYLDVSVNETGDLVFNTLMAEGFDIVISQDGDLIIQIN